MLQEKGDWKVNREAKGFEDRIEELQIRSIPSIKRHMLACTIMEIILKDRCL